MMNLKSTYDHMIRKTVMDKIESEREIPATNTYIEVADDGVFLFRESTMLDVRSQVIQPSQSATFSTSLKPCELTN